MSEEVCYSFSLKSKFNVQFFNKLNIISEVCF